MSNYYIFVHLRWYLGGGEDSGIVSVFKLFSFYQLPPPKNQKETEDSERARQ